MPVRAGRSRSIEDRPPRGRALVGTHGLTADVGVRPYDMRRHGRLCSCALLVVLGSAATACASSGPSSSVGTSKRQIRQSNLAASAKPSVAVLDQMTNGYTVTVTSVTYPKTSVPSNSDDEGVVAVAPDVNGVRGDVAGFVTVRPGTTMEVHIASDAQLTSGRYVVSLYADNRLPSSAERALASTSFVLTVG